MKKFVEDIRQLFLTPSDFFQKETKQKDIKVVAIYYVALLVISAIFNLASFLVLAFYVNKVGLSTQDIIPVLVSSLASIFAALLFGFIWSFLLHSYLKLFKSKGNYQKTYQIFAYSSAPSLLLGWVPAINFLASFYGIYLIIISTEILHKISRRRSVAAYLLLLTVVLLYEALRAATG